MAFLQSQMHGVRSRIEADVDQFRESTRKLTDWKSYIRAFPLTVSALGLAAGYMLVPHRKHIVSPDADTIARLAKRNKLVVQSNPKPEDRASLGGILFGLASSMLMRGVTTYVAGQVGRITAGLESGGKRETNDEHGYRNREAQE